jgi:hypothetical protein
MDYSLDDHNAIKRYTNEVGRASPAIIDTRAFACPADG